MSSYGTRPLAKSTAHNFVLNGHHVPERLHPIRCIVLTAHLHVVKGDRFFEQHLCKLHRKASKRIVSATVQIDMRQLVRRNLRNECKRIMCLSLLR